MRQRAPVPPSKKLHARHSKHANGAHVHSTKTHRHNKSQTEKKQTASSLPPPSTQKKKEKEGDREPISSRMNMLGILSIKPWKHVSVKSYFKSYFVHNHSHSYFVRIKSYFVHSKSYSVHTKSYSVHSKSYFVHSKSYSVHTKSYCVHSDSQIPASAFFPYDKPTFDPCAFQGMGARHLPHQRLLHLAARSEEAPTRVPPRMRGTCYLRGDTY
jgi:hypothetical protein